jgi:hypothetical protein
MPCLGLSHTKKPASYPDCELAFFVYWGQAQVVPPGGNWSDVPAKYYNVGGNHSNNYRRLQPVVTQYGIGPAFFKIPCSYNQ